MTELQKLSFKKLNRIDKSKKPLLVMDRKTRSKIFVILDYEMYEQLQSQTQKTVTEPIKCKSQLEEFDYKARGLFWDCPQMSNQTFSQILNDRKSPKFSWAITRLLERLNSQEVLKLFTVEEIAALINATEPDIVWVGLGAPKQEYWMAKLRPLLRAPVLVGVGAAFDFNSGLKPLAPNWMRKNGLEWFYRLISEPRRLWRRYFYVVPVFIILSTFQMLKIRKY